MILIITPHIDAIIDTLQHPFFMTIWGIFAWFVFRWSKMRNRAKKKGRKFNLSIFWDDQKDEILACFVVGLTIIVWDDEFIDWIGYEGEVSSGFNFMVGAITERVYTLIGGSDDGG